jgi:hypothetical protein
MRGEREREREREREERERGERKRWLKKIEKTIKFCNLGLKTHRASPSLAILLALKAERRI